MSLFDNSAGNQRPDLQILEGGLLLRAESAWVLACNRHVALLGINARHKHVDDLSFPEVLARVFNIRLAHFAYRQEGADVVVKKDDRPSWQDSSESPLILRSGFGAFI